MGSYESTFTFRIQEEREIMGMEVDQTFGLLCPEGERDCKRSNVWKVTHGEKPSSKSHNEL